MDITQIATQLLQSKMGSETSSPDMIQNALGGLLGGESGSGIDISSLVSNMGSGGLMSLAASWLGDGENASISNDQVKSLLGSEQVNKFASQLGVSEDSALGGLSDMLPKLVDQSSKGGSLLDSVGGVGGALNMAKGLFS